MSDFKNFKKKLESLYKDNRDINKDDYLKKLDLVTQSLNFEDTSIREHDDQGQPGGVIDLNRNIPTIIVPDLHARVYFIRYLLNHRIDDKTVLELLFLSKIQIICVGDGFHSERRCKDRWLAASIEFENGFNTHKNIDMEMSESLGLMSLIIELKIKFPKIFHFLKGNHENILNEEGYGNYPFGKFTSEGYIVRSWVEKFYGEDFLYKYSSFEKSLPLFVIGRNFLVSHAEPGHFYERSEIVNCYNNHNLIYDLTWTRDNQAEIGSVERMLKRFIDKEYLEKSLYFGGHCSISSIYSLRANSKFVQIHNPERCQITYIKTDRDINLVTDIGDIDGENTF